MLLRLPLLLLLTVVLLQWAAHAATKTKGGNKVAATAATAALLNDTAVAAAAAAKLMEDMGGTDSVQQRYAKDKRVCTSMRANYNVKPGVNWGLMDSKKDLQDRWIALNCDKFFCQKHKLAGKGIYQCLPLEEYAQLKSSGGGGSGSPESKA
jgi:hypothetical protein